MVTPFGFVDVQEIPRNMWSLPVVERQGSSASTPTLLVRASIAIFAAYPGIAHTDRGMLSIQATRQFYVYLRVAGVRYDLLLNEDERGRHVLPPHHLEERW